MSCHSCEPGGDAFTLRNEFATVELTVDQRGGAHRLSIRDVQLGTQIHLDALELESLTRAEHSDFESLVLNRLPDLGDTNGAHP